MPNQDDQEASLKKLGEHLREGFASQQPPAEKSLQTVKDAVTEGYELEQAELRKSQASPALDKDSERQPDEPEQDR